MFCLFKNSKLTPPLNLLSLILSWGLVLYWSYFAFIEKSFLERVFTGQAMFVDLLFGLPIVLIFAIVIYAMVSWSFKVIIILLYPAGVIQLSTEVSDEELDEINQFNQELDKTEAGEHSSGIQNSLDSSESEKNASQK